MPSARIFSGTLWRSRLYRVFALIEELTAEFVANIFPPPKQVRIDCSIHMLVSGRSAAMGLIALRSFQRNAGFVCPVIFYDDGSLGRKAGLLKRRAAKGVTVEVISREQSAALIEKLSLANPATAAALRKWVFVRKYLAPYLFSPTAKYILMDSDVIFFRRPREVLNWLSDATPSWWFNQDCVYAYTHKADELESAFAIRLWMRVNAGLSLLDRRLFDLELAERFFRFIGETCEKHFWVEQTLYAVEASTHGQGGFLPPTYQVTYGRELRLDAVSRHYIDNLKPALFYSQGVVGFIRQDINNSLRKLTLTPTLLKGR